VVPALQNKCKLNEESAALVPSAINSETNFFHNECSNIDFGNANIRGEAFRLSRRYSQRRPREAFGPEARSEGNATFIMRYPVQSARER
jgi:hypothetical protein